MPERISLQYENLSENWAKDTSDFNKQYSSIYLIRLKQMSEFLVDEIKFKWKDNYPTCKLHKLSEQKHEKSIVIGTLFKEQKLKPSILKQLAKGQQLVPQPILTCFTDSSDKLFIEDELQRYVIVGNLPYQKLVTGITCALLGIGDDKGTFVVEDYAFVDYRAQIPRPFFDEAIYFVFLSGLDLVHNANYEANLQMLINWLRGLINLEDIETSKIVRVIIAGNSIRNIAETESPVVSLLSKRNEPLETLECVKLLDNFLLQLSYVVDVDVMPGENDPSNHILPQKPMHHCMFPRSFRNQSITQVSNPYYFSLDNLKILGSSGQPIRDILRYSEIENPLDALESCLKWSHLAPTAPDTLGCFPYHENDPFIITECPHVFFAGNQNEFATKDCTGRSGQCVRLFTIPEFSSTLELCLLNIKNLEISVVSLKFV